VTASLVLLACYGGEGVSERGYRRVVGRGGCTGSRAKAVEKGALDKPAPVCDHEGEWLSRWDTPAHGRSDSGEGESELSAMLTRWFGRAHGQSGQGLVEYALIIALVAVIVISALILLGPQLASIFQNTSHNM
jgi:pilus assembly protein Flp/PilA